MDEFDDDHLISLVQQYPQLWDKNSSEFKNKACKANAWKMIGEIMHCSAEDCERRFVVLRNKYGAEKRHLKVSSSSGMGAAHPSAWPHFSAMGFLDRYMQTRKRRTVSNVTASAESAAGSSLSPVQSPQSQSYTNLGPTSSISSCSVWDTMTRLTSDPATPQDVKDDSASSEVTRDSASSEVTRDSASSEVARDSASSEVARRDSASSEVARDDPLTPHVAREPGPSRGIKRPHTQTTGELRRAVPWGRRKAQTADDAVVSSLQSTLSTVNDYFARQAPPSSIVAQTQSFSSAMAQLLSGIRNNRRRRRTEAAVMTLIADTASDSEDSS